MNYHQGIGLTVKELKDLIKDWPETDHAGQPSEVFLQTGHMLSGPCRVAEPLNLRGYPGNETADLLLSYTPE